MTHAAIKLAETRRMSESPYGGVFMYWRWFIMIIKKDDILAAMAGKIDAADAERVADILCRANASLGTVSVVDDDTAFEPDDGAPEKPEMIAPCIPAVNTRPDMIALPTRLFNGGWFRNDIRARFNKGSSSSFFAAMHDLGTAACEPVYLASVLRQAYGPADLPVLMDDAVFSQPAYAPFKRDVEPILQKYFY